MTVKLSQHLAPWRKVVLWKVSAVVWAAVHFPDALPWTTGLRNANEACAWQPEAETQPLSPSGMPDVRHNVGTGCCISCIAKASPLYIPFLLSSAACSPLLICLFVFGTFIIWEKKKITRGQRHKQPYLIELKAVHNWVAEYRGDIPGLNQNNGFQVYSFIKGKSFNNWILQWCWLGIIQNGQKKNLSDRHWLSEK